MYCITYSNVYYMETCLKLIHFQGSSDSTTFRLCSIIRTSNYIQHPVHLHFHKYYYHAYNGLTVHQSDFFSPPPPKKKRKIILEQKCPFNNGTSQQLSHNHSLLRLIVWKGQHPFIGIPEEEFFTITTVLLPCSFMEPPG